MSLKAMLRSVLPISWVSFIQAMRSPYLLHRSFRYRLGAYVRLWSATVSGPGLSSDVEVDMARIREYAHRLDKSLERSDWESGHGQKEYYEVRSLLDKNAHIDNETTRWAGGICESYRRFQDEGRFRRSEGRGRSSLQLSADDLLRFMQERRSCRFFLEKRVPESVVERIIEAAIEAPWSCNRMALQVYSYTLPQRAADVLKCFNGFTAFSSYVPCAFVFCVDLRAYSMPQEIFVPHLDVGLAAENAALMATALGVSMAFLSWGSSNCARDEQLRKILGIPWWCEIVVGAACGYPSRIPGKPARRSVDEVLTISTGPS